MFDSYKEKTRLRAPAFTDKEDEALIKTYFKYRNIIRSKNATGVTQQIRNEAWEMVSKAVNSADGRFQRTVKSVKIHYGNMLAEYKAYKAKEKSTGTAQETQVFYKYFDELLTEKERASSSEVNEETQVDSFDSSFMNDEKIFITGSSSYELDNETHYALRFNKEGTSLDAENNKALARFFAFQQDVKIEPTSQDYLKLNEIIKQNNENVKEVNKVSVFDQALRTVLNNDSATSMLLNKEKDKKLHNLSSKLHKKVAKRTINSLRTKILQHQLEVLQRKNEMLRKKSQLLDLKIQREMDLKNLKQNFTSLDSLFSVANNNVENDNNKLLISK